MKTVSKSLTLAALGLYISFVTVMSFHSLCKDHVESQCVLCQIAHQTPVIRQGTPAIQRQESFRLLSGVVFPMARIVVDVFHYGRSPPSPLVSSVVGRSGLIPR